MQSSRLCGIRLSQQQGRCNLRRNNVKGLRRGDVCVERIIPRSSRAQLSMNCNPSISTNPRLPCHILLPQPYTSIHSQWILLHWNINNVSFRPLSDTHTRFICIAFFPTIQFFQFKLAVCLYAVNLFIRKKRGGESLNSVAIIIPLVPNPAYSFEACASVCVSSCWC